MKGWFGYEGMLFACVYAPEFPAQALLRQKAALQNHPVAVLEGAPPQEKVCAANARARRDGVLAGMTRVEAESFAGIVLLSRSAAMEAEAREALLGCIGTFTPQAETCHTDTEAVCVLDVSGMARLHPDPRTFAVNLQATLRSRRLFASVALSANFYTACALARGVQGVTVAAPGDEQKMLSPLLLEVLAVSEEQLRTLALWGIRTLGGLAALPQKQLIARMGQQGKRLRELARGEHAHLFAPADVPLELREEYAFEEPVRLLEEILYVLSPMLDHLLLQVRERALAIATLTVTFALEVHAFVSVESGENCNGLPGGNSLAADSGTHPQRYVLAEAENGLKTAGPEVLTPQAVPAAGTYQRVLRPSMPTVDRRLLLKLLELDLAAHPPASAVLAVVLQAHAAKKGAVQEGLFAPPLPEPSRLDVTLARLSALVGEGRVGSPQLRDTHAADCFSVETFRNEVVAPARQSPVQKHAPALRHLRPPEPAQVYLEAYQPARFWFRGEHFLCARLAGRGG